MSDSEEEIFSAQPTPTNKNKQKGSPGITSGTPEAGFFDTPTSKVSATSTPKSGGADKMDQNDSLDFQRWKFERELEERQRQREHEIAMLERQAQIDREKQDRKRINRDQEIKTMQEFELQKEKKKTLKNLTVSAMTDDCKIDTFLDNFEKLATTCGWEKATWVVRLAPSLRGQAADAYRELDPKDGTDYDALKTAILTRYQLNAGSYRRQFKVLVKSDNQTVTAWVNELSRLYFKWIGMVGIEIPKNALPLAHWHIVDQALSRLPSEVTVYLKEKEPKTPERLGKLADQYIERMGGQKWYDQISKKSKQSANGNSKPFKKDSDKPGKTNHANKADNSNKQGGPKCYACQEIGHISTKCPNKTKEFKPTPAKKTSTEIGTCVPSLAEKYKMGGTINNQKVTILRDSACDLSIVAERFINPADYTGEEVVIRHVVGNQSVKLAKVLVTCEYGTTVMEVGVGPNFYDEDYHMLLGNDMVKYGWPLEDLIVTPTEVSKNVNKVVTRQQAKQVIDDKQDSKSKVETVQYFKPPEALKVGKDELINLQQNDDTLRKVREKVIDLGDVEKETACFYIENGILLRKWMRKDTMYQQVVVPIQLRTEVMKMAHEPPTAGHLGVNKTKQRILASFYWPNIFKDVAEFCKTCHICQVHRVERPQPKAPLQPISSMGDPFKKVGIDIIGPLDMTKSKKRYILVAVDYATRFPVAIPLSNIRSSTIADELIGLFCMVGPPDEIISDNGSDFKSQLMTQVTTALGIRQSFSSPYHHQTVGLVERFNGTLKSMMKTLDEEQWKIWDKYIPYFCFAYREVPQDSTGFSPFELLYPHKVKGPLEIVKQQWMNENPGEKDVIQYVLDMRSRMKDMLDVAQNNIEKAQKKQKRWYDEKARERKYDVGQKVLLLLPDEVGKMKAKWSGPYSIVRKVDDLNYEVSKQNKVKKYHVNLLAPYHERVVTCKYISTYEFPEVDEEADYVHEPEYTDPHDELPVHELQTCQTQDVHDVNIYPDLTHNRQGELQHILSDFDKRFNDVPGQTDIIEHDPTVEHDRPIRRKPYTIPKMKRGQVKAELDKMKEMGIIEPSTSPYASPMVIVMKKNGNVRICGDFRSINQITTFDPYPVPNIEDITDDVAKGRYITTLDLTRGFYQVPLSDRGKRLSAFISPWGLYQYRVMPFGLKNSGATFQRLIDIVLADCMDYARGYLDDIVIFSETWDEHMTHLTEVLTRLQKAGLTAKPDKCYFAMPKAQYLGYVVGEGEIEPQQSKIESMEQFPMPQTKSKLKSFLGLTGYYSKFVPHYASITVPLTDMTRKRIANKLTWTANAKQAFETLKEKLVSAPILQAPNFDLEFVLQTDASDYGIGAVLSQIDADGNEHPIRYLSRKLKDAEQRYTVSEKECLAIVWAIRKLYAYLYAKPFVLETDHKALKWLKSANFANDRLARWSLALQPYAFTVKFKKGSKNNNADALSRL